MKRPNILLVFTDQQRYDTIAAHGNPVIKTPVLDRLVAEGITFPRAYTPCPVCVPARYAMHTGQLPHRTGVFENYEMPMGRRSFMEILSDSGYQTFGTGKMHFTFKTGYHTLWGFDKRAPDRNPEAPETFQLASEMYYIPQVSPLTEKHHNTSWIADTSIDFLKNRDADKPFFMMTSFPKPHPPFEPPVPWNKIYRGPDMPLPKVPANSEALQTLWNKFQNRYKYRDQGNDLNLIRQMKAHYYAEISFIDYNLGRIFDCMEDLDVMDDTLIIYTADHGEMLGDYNCYGKRCFLDSAARIPMIVKYPGCAKNSTCPVPVTLVDVLPTFLDHAGIPPSEDYSGESMIRLAEGTAQRETIYCQYEQEGYASYMNLNGQYKYIYSAPDDKEFLFDLVMDPEETRNKAQSPLFIEKTREMREQMVAFFREEGYETPIEGNGWKKYPKKEMPDDPDAYLLFQDPEKSIPHIPGYETDSSQKKYFKFMWYENRYPVV